MSNERHSEGFEKKFAMDEESKFKAMARRNKLLGLWAAEKLGKTGAEADAYAKEVVRADFEEAGDNDVFRKVRADFDAAGVAQLDNQIRAMMEGLMATAIEQIRKDLSTVQSDRNRFWLPGREREVARLASARGRGGPQRPQVPPKLRRARSLGRPTAVV